MRPKHLNLFVQMILLFFLICALSYAFFTASEELIVRNALREVDHKWFSTDPSQLVISLHQSICDPERLSLCHVEFKDTAHGIVHSVPSLAKTNGFIFFVKRKSVKINYFIEDVEVTITQAPTFKYSAIIFLFSIFSFVPFALFFLYLSRSREVRLLNKNIKLQSSFNSLANQVAHDIRSPLMVLDVIAKESVELNEAKRMQIVNSVKRIYSVADELLEHKREIKQGRSVFSGDEEVYQQKIYSLINDLVIEKRIQYKNRCNIQLEFICSDEARLLLCEVNPSHFTRVLSNIINNSFESIVPDKKGSVLISLERDDSHRARIDVKDNGKGISEADLSAIFKKGASFGKIDGNGLGLSYAQEKISSWGGEIKVESILNVGTKFCLLLPAFPQRKKCNILIDNDELIRTIWLMQAKKEKIALQVFRNSKSFLDVCDSFDLDSSIYIDSELDDGEKGEESSLELFNLGFKNIILVTGHPKEKFETFAHISQVVGKEPPW